MTIIQHGLRWFENFITTAALLVLTISTILGVVSRYIMNSPLIWTQEVALIAFIWLTLVGASIVIREGNHIQINLIAMLSEKKQRIFECISWLAVIVILLFFIFYGYLHTMSATDNTTAIQLPWKYIFAAVPIGSLLMLIRSIEKLVGLMNGSIRLNEEENQS